MRIHLCGVRGSTPAPGAEFVRYGGHTSCVATAPDDGAPEPGAPRLILDAGTGLRRVTGLLGGAPFAGTIILTHLHWDHVHGLPFFSAGDRDDARVTLLLPNRRPRTRGEAVQGQAASPSPHSDHAAGLGIIPQPGAGVYWAEGFTRWSEIRTRAAPRLPGRDGTPRWPPHPPTPAPAWRALAPTAGTNAAEALAAGADPLVPRSFLRPHEVRPRAPIRPPGVTDCAVAAATSGRPPRPADPPQARTTQADAPRAPSPRPPTPPAWRPPSPWPAEAASLSL